MSKNHKLNRKKGKIVVCILVMLLIVLVIVALLLSRNKMNESGDSFSSEEILLDEGLKIIRTDEYDGPYFEDGSNEEVSGIQMIILENTTEQDLQYAEIIVEHKDETAEYAVTNLPAGKKVLILEKNRMKYTNKDIMETALENIIFLEKMPLYEDIIEIQGLDGIVNVKNISENDISSDLYIYYKNIEKEMYLGGITYRIKIEGGLKAGEIRQLGANHFKADSCEILMVSGLE